MPTDNAFVLLWNTALPTYTNAPDVSRISAFVLARLAEMERTKEGEARRITVKKIRAADRANLAVAEKSSDRHFPAHHLDRFHILVSDAIERLPPARAVE